jgi:hypothetical protein
MDLIRAEAYYRKHKKPNDIPVNIEWKPNNWWRIGGQGTGNDIFEKRIDRDGSNLNANYLTLGTGELNEYLKYLCKYNGIVLVEYNLMFKTNNLSKSTYVEHDICVGPKWGDEEKFHIRQGYSDGRNNVMTIYRSQSVRVKENDYISIDVNISRDPMDPNFSIVMHPFHNSVYFDNFISFTYLNKE